MASKYESHSFELEPHAKWARVFNSLVINDSRGKLHVNGVSAPYDNGLRRGRKATALNIKACDLFSGCGGLTLGLERNGISPIFSADIDPASVATMAFNRQDSDSRIYCGDIRNLTSLPSVGQIDLLVGGPPCQGFSLANQQKSENDHERNNLVITFLEYAALTGSRYILIENVPGMLSYHKDLLQVALQYGYHTHPILLNAADFGLPQNRSRAFVFGVRSSETAQEALWKALESRFVNHMPTTRRWVLSDALGDLPKVEAKSISNKSEIEDRRFGMTFMANGAYAVGDYVKWINAGSISCPVINHKTKYLNARDRIAYSLLEEGLASSESKNAHLFPYQNRADIFKDKFFRLSRTRVSKTITSHMYYDCHMYIHPTQDRGITPREAARIQGFPDDYVFLGQPNEWYRQVGNAVSPPMAALVIRVFLEEIGMSDRRRVA